VRVEQTVPARRVISSPPCRACVGRGTASLSQRWEAAGLPAKATLNAALGLSLQRAGAARSERRGFQPAARSGMLFPNVFPNVVSQAILPQDE